MDHVTFSSDTPSNSHPLLQDSRMQGKSDCQKMLQKIFCCFDPSEDAHIISIAIWFGFDYDGRPYVTCLMKSVKIITLDVITIVAINLNCRNTNQNCRKNHNCRNANHNCRNYFEKNLDHVNINTWLKEGVSLGFLNINSIFHNIVAIFPC